jgi:hypothetical protein
MKADAKPSAEADALQWAIVFFSVIRAELTPDGSKSVAYDAETIVYMHDEWGKEESNDVDYRAYLARLFRVSITPEGDPAVFELCALAATLIERGEPLSGPLKTFIVKFLRRDPIFVAAKKPGPKGGHLAHRDVCIGEAIEYLAKTWKFPATRNVATDRPCAASIVREALEKGAGVHLTEAAVNKIWRWYVR